MSSTVQRILVVDDDPEIRKLLARYIESQGFRVLLAANCRELRDKLATNHIDLIVELTVIAVERGDGKPHAPRCGGRPRSPHADHPHAAQSRVRRG
ncbi:MAG: response regulator [Methyloceanibacter sp.]|nr:response regulator [Methyloceanibacter sp.]